MNAIAAAFVDSIDLLEKRRADVVRATGLLDTEPDAEFDELVGLAREVCGTTMGAMTLLDEKEQFIKGASGLENGRSGRDASICDQVVRDSSPLVVRDTLLDARFRDMACVQGTPNIRFYSGVPLFAETGETLGAMCVMDTEPRALTAAQQRALHVLARQMEARIRLCVRIRQEQEETSKTHAERDLLQQFLNSMPMEATLKDRNGRMLFYNQAVANHFHISRTEWLGKTVIDIWGPELGAKLRADEEAVLRTGKRTETYVEIPVQNGTEFWKSIRSSFSLPCGEQLLANVGVNLTEELKREAALMKLQDELEEANRKLRSLCLTDELTGLWNRRAFDARLEMELHDAERRPAPLALLLMDVDNFKSFNDTYGHSHGDEVLAEVGAALRHAVRAHDMPVRYGGEEFAIIAPGADLEGARAMAVRIAELLQAVRWKYRSVTMSIGIAMHRHGTSSDDLLGRADAAMYHAKRNGKNRAVVYGEELMFAGVPPATELLPVLSSCPA